MFAINPSKEDLQQTAFRQADMILYMNVDLSKQSSQQIIREMLEFVVIQLRRHTSENHFLNRLRLWYDRSEGQRSEDDEDTPVTAFS
ncbi:hypothetical protein AAES_131595 [Amazona aestiva]|uniref:Uncharacterized protein n=1 Tax=Amazona aestiva TaxID=12930 RepID=A0A0Q3M272_AMAAE|nr:hypothetical protein AAES_131595 [Amazona aestiva]